MPEPYRMFLDDIRDPPNDGGDWVIVRSYDDAVGVVQERGFPSLVSFDHDLGDQVPSGKDFANWLVELDMNTGAMPDDFEFRVHSANPVGAANIRGLLESYLQIRRAQGRLL